MEKNPDGKKTERKDRMTLKILLVTHLAINHALEIGFLLVLSDLTPLLFDFSPAVFPTEVEAPRSPGTMLYSLSSRVLSTMPFP